MINVFLLTLNLYKIDINNVVEVFTTSMQQLDTGCTLSIYKENTLICAFSIIIIKNMSQQADNEGFLCYSAKIDC